MEGKQITKFFDNKGYHKMLQREKHLQVNVKIQHIFAIESKINVTTPWYFYKFILEISNNISLSWSNNHIYFPYTNIYLSTK